MTHSWDVASTYDSFLISHAPRIASIESSLRSLTWFLPGRFQDAEVASEALSAAVNLVSSYHDSVIVKLAETLPMTQRPAPSSHTRYVVHWMENSKPYRIASRSLMTIRYFQLLIEMITKRKFGSDARWRVVLALEVVKAALRLSMFRATRSRPTVWPPVPGREIDPSQLPPSPNGSPASSFMADSTDYPAPNQRVNGCAPTDPNYPNANLSESWRGTRTGRERPTIASLRSSYSPRSGSPSASGDNGTRDAQTEVNDFLLARVLSVEDVKRPVDLIKALESPSAQLAELIWIIRPVLYVLAIQKYGFHHRYPFVLSLAMELAWSNLRSRTSGPSYLISDLERIQIANRRGALWWYFLRGPLWKDWTRGNIEGIINSLQNKPFVGIVASFAHEYVALVNNLYYYTSN